MINNGPSSLVVYAKSNGCNYYNFEGVSLISCTNVLNQETKSAVAVTAYVSFLIEEISTDLRCHICF